MSEEIIVDGRQAITFMPSGLKLVLGVHKEFRTLLITSSAGLTAVLL